MTTDKTYLEVDLNFKLEEDAPGVKLHTDYPDAMDTPIVPPKSFELLPGQVIVAIIIGKPGAVAIFGDNGLPREVRMLRRLKRGERLEPTRLLAEIFQNLPDIGTIAKVVIGPNYQALIGGRLDKPSIDGCTECLYHLLNWLNIPTILANPGWLTYFPFKIVNRSALYSLNKLFANPGCYALGFASEQCARATFLGIFAVTCPDWSGVKLWEHSDASPVVTPPIGHISAD